MLKKDIFYIVMLVCMINFSLIIHPSHFTKLEVQEMLRQQKAKEEEKEEEDKNQTQRRIEQIDQGNAYVRSQNEHWRTLSLINQRQDQFEQTVDKQQAKLISKKYSKRSKAQRAQIGKEQRQAKRGQKKLDRAEQETYWAHLLAVQHQKAEKEEIANKQRARLETEKERNLRMLSEEVSDNENDENTLTRDASHIEASFVQKNSVSSLEPERDYDLERAIANSLHQQTMPYNDDYDEQLRRALELSMQDQKNNDQNVNAQIPPSRPLSIVNTPKPDATVNTLQDQKDYEYVRPGESEEVDKPTQNVFPITSLTSRSNPELEHDILDSLHYLSPTATNFSSPKQQAMPYDDEDEDEDEQLKRALELSMQDQKNNDQNLNVQTPSDHTTPEPATPTNTTQPKHITKVIFKLPKNRRRTKVKNKHNPTLTKADIERVLSKRSRLKDFQNNSNSDEDKE